MVGMVYLESNDVELNAHSLCCAITSLIFFIKIAMLEFYGLLHVKLIYSWPLLALYLMALYIFAYLLFMIYFYLAVFGVFLVKLSKLSRH